MQAVRLLKTKDLALVDIPQPQPGPGEIVIKVEAAGVCGTDRHLFLGEFPCKGPVTLGHEFSGIVSAVGAGVELPLGTRVTCDPNDPCLTCAQCLRGRVNLCSRNSVTGITRDGGFAPFACFPARKAIVLPDDLHPHHGAFCEPLSCTLHGMDLAALRPGERCLIIGGGVIGLMAVQLARLAGAEVMLLTRSKAKQDLALSFGATAIAAAPDQVLSIWPEGADTVIECAGVVQTIECAPRLTRNGGRIVILGVLPQGQKVQIEPFDLLFREISILHSFLNPFTQQRAAHLIASGAVQVAPMISRLVPLEQLVDCIANPALPGEIRVLAVPQ
ncbi:MAG: zinc-dependent alcohol dehydrogenase family protein [Rhodobacteraceae bacterium]|nr:zinc-dependent alcohol dehydrogenase family protein [Paracoccaceae bacterium]MCF8515314.1 zinc-dependent alcohol dehydrogenase family protein [Paracoccaceae bacterium]MCF8519502.1 zinc-dependent alcohol dehydrogenase family protein [Paracoccaceae bacterium]